jgi:chaperonin GroEL
MGKKIIYDDEALLQLKQGVATLSKAVKVTYGPKGRNVVLENRYGIPSFCKDGVTVAKTIELENPFENAGAQMIKQVAEKTAEEAGDGTTTAIIIAEKLLSDGIKVVVAGINPMLLKKGIEKALDAALKELERMAKPVDTNKELNHIAAIAANQDVMIGNLIAKAFENKGSLNIVEVEEAKGVASQLRWSEGIEINGSLFSSYFINDPVKNEAVLESALVLITDKKIAATADLIPLLQQVVDAKSPLVIIAKEIQEDVLSMLVANCRNHVIQCIAAKSSAAGERLQEELEDVALLTGTEFFSEDKGHQLKNISVTQLGRVNKAVVSNGKIRLIKDDTVNTKTIKKTLDNLHQKFTETKSESERGNINKRIARLTGGVAIISIGATTETELKEKLYRTDDAVRAVRAALEEGTVPGGGITYLQLSKKTSVLKSENREEQIGMNILSAALSAPFIALANNAGLQSPAMIESIINAPAGKGYDLNTGQLVDMRKAGILDPAKVVKTALKNAVSIATELLKIKAVITEEIIINELQNELHATGN